MNYIIFTKLYDIKDFNLTQHIFKHEKTDTIYQHVENKDPNNLFAIQFRTLPENHKGVPHILEHMALCGSKHYPVRDPFFKMIKRYSNNDKIPKYIYECIYMSGSDMLPVLYLEWIRL